MITDVADPSVVAKGGVQQVVTVRKEKNDEQPFIFDFELDAAFDIHALDLFLGPALFVEGIDKQSGKDHTDNSECDVDGVHGRCALVDREYCIIFQLSVNRMSCFFV